MVAAGYLSNYIEPIEKYPRINQFYPQGHYMISSVLDFPTPVDGIIRLDANTAYHISGKVNLGGARLVADGHVSIVGLSPELDYIKSTGLPASTPLLTSSYTVSMNNVSLEHATILDLDSTGRTDTAIDWYGVNFRNATNAVGTIKNYPNVIMNTIGFLNAGGLTFDGTIGTISFLTSIFSPASGQKSIILKDTLTISRRFRAMYSAFVILSGQTGIELQSGASIPTESFKLINNSFSGGGAYINGINNLDDRSEWDKNTGIANSGTSATYTMSDNATTTTVSQIGTYYKVAGVTVAGNNVQRFDVDSVDNRAICKAVVTTFYSISAHASFTSGTNNIIAFRIAVDGVVQEDTTTKTTSNGTRNENTPIFGTVELAKDSYVEIFVANLTATNNITVTDMHVRIERQTV